MRHVLLLVTLVLIGVQTKTALAQGTPAQREACTPDAIRLCSDTIPDIAKTTGCMKAHTAELSPACRAVVGPAEPTAAPARSTVVPLPLHAAATTADTGKRAGRRYRQPAGRPLDDPDAEVAYVPPRRVIEPPVYEQPGPVIFPAQPYPDGSFCSPPYDFCEPTDFDREDPE